MTVEAIKDAIAGLPATERHALTVWLNELDYDPWERQMAEDFSPGGRGHALVDRVQRQIAEGRALPFAEAASQSKRREP